MIPQEKTYEVIEGFDEKFGDKEGCQNFGDNCGKKAKVSGNFLCSICEKWGGQQGVVKDWKRPLGSLKQIKDFIRQKLAFAYQQGKDDAEFELKKLQTMTAYQQGRADNDKDWLKKIEEGLEESRSCIEFIIEDCFQVTLPTDKVDCADIILSQVKKRLLK